MRQRDSVLVDCTVSNIKTQYIRKNNSHWYSGNLTRNPQIMKVQLNLSENLIYRFRVRGPSGTA